MEKVWAFIEKIIRFLLIKFSQGLRVELTDNFLEKILQFIKFGIVGVSNTLISYVVYIILVSIGSYYLFASLVGFFISVLNAFYWNNKYVFASEDGEKRVWWQVFCKTFFSYAGTGLILHNILLIFWVDVLHIHEMLAPIINLFITIPLNFLLNKYWAFRKKQ